VSSSAKEIFMWTTDLFCDEVLSVILLLLRFLSAEKIEMLSYDSEQKGVSAGAHHGLREGEMHEPIRASNFLLHFCTGLLTTLGAYWLFAMLTF
jgi:hypothetical protein